MKPLTANPNEVDLNAFVEETVDERTSMTNASASKYSAANAIASAAASDAASDAVIDDVYDENALIHKFIDEYQAEYDSVVDFYSKYSISRDPTIRSSIKSVLDFIQKRFRDECKLRKYEIRKAPSSLVSSSLVDSQSFLRLRLMNEYNNLTDYFSTLITPQPNWHLIEELISIRKRVSEFIDARRMDKRAFYAFRGAIPMRREYYGIRSVIDYATFVL